MPSYKTHIVASIPVSMYLSSSLNLSQLSPEFTLLSLAATSLGSLIPDIDTPHSFIGRRLFPISWIINKIFGHRKLFHSIIFYTVLLLISPIYFQGDIAYAVIPSLYFGIISHILLDRVATLVKYKHNKRFNKTFKSKSYGKPYNHRALKRKCNTRCYRAS